MQQLALFDLDNTLVDRSEAFRRWAAEFVAERSLPADAAAWLVACDGDGFVPRDRFFTLARQRFTLDDPVEELCAGYRRRMPELVTCRPEVLRALTYLRGHGWRLAIVTNGSPDNQSGKIHRTGLADCVDAWVVSGELGVRKPAREIFDAAARRCGASLADGGWAIGDSPALDVAGGQAAGLTTVWVTRAQRWPAETAGPDHSVDDVVEVVELMLAG
jgi:putative hydrolase of the HAD superfamily